MIDLKEYTNITEIYESNHSIVYQAIRASDRVSVFLKALKPELSIPAEIARYQQEYEITHLLNSENLAGVIVAYSIEEYQRRPVIVFEDFGGVSLKILMNNPTKFEKLKSLPSFLPIDIQISEILGQIHDTNIIHKDINPNNILVNPTTGQAKIIDFGIATALNRQSLTLKSPNMLEGTLAYISPEQTGRMNRSLDYRTDFYSLGVTFYEILTGNLPFITDDALELLHCHIAKQPTPPQEINPEIKSSIADIILKLMAKIAENRYQSAYGIKADLEECLNQLQSTGKIQPFALGRLDISDRFQLSQKLYGREKEVEILLQSFAGIRGQQSQTLLKTAKPAIMLVAGYSGIGKSALVAEVYKPITEARGYFIVGKFDQLQQNIPYSAITKAFASLLRQILTESESELEQWRSQLLAALGDNGKVIIDVIPEVQFIIGEQPEVTELGAMESQNRFNLVFGNFMRVFCASEHPLVIFLDDLQAGRELLAENSWSSDYELTLKLSEETVEAEYLSSNFERADELAEQILQQAKNKLDKVKSYELKVQTYIAQNQPVKALETGLQAIDFLEVSLVNDITVVLPELTNIDDLPEMTDGLQLAAMRVLMAICPAAYFTKPGSLQSIVLTMIDLTQQKGYSSLAAYGYIWHAALCAATGKIEAGYQAGQLAMNLVEKYHAKKLKAKVINLFCALVRHWKEPERDSIPILQEGIQSGLDTGDNEYACYCIKDYCVHLFLTGKT